MSIDLGTRSRSLYRDWERNGRASHLSRATQRDATVPGIDYGCLRTEIPMTLVLDLIWFDRINKRGERLLLLPASSESRSPDQMADGYCRETVAVSPRPILVTLRGIYRSLGFVAANHAAQPTRRRKRMRQASPTNGTEKRPPVLGVDGPSQQAKPHRLSRSNPHQLS